MVSDLEKIINFLKEYRDIYGDDIFVDPDKIRKGTDQISTAPLALSPDSILRSQPPERAGHKMKSASPLGNFMREIKDCTKCPLGHTRTKFVFGDGNEKAGIMFIGEAPGKDEDLSGIPFVGRAGQLLNRLLTGINLDRRDVFIANILKCRPPNNRDPQPAEVKECFPYLHQQIELIKPRLIVALGRVAAQNLLETTDALTKLRERLWQYRGVSMIVTYHPAAILRNMGLLPVTEKDFKFILQTYQDLTRSKP